MKRNFSAMSTDMDTSVSTTSTPRNSLKRRRFSSKGALNARQRREVTNLIHRNQELKYFATVASAGAISSTMGLATSNFDVPQGDTDQSRDGDQLMWCGHIDFHMQMVNGQGATGDIYNNIRLILFQWHPNTTPAALDVFIAGPSGGPDVYSQYNHDKRQMFTILWDKNFTTVGNASAATSPNTNFVTTGIKKFRIPLTKAQKKVQYSGGTTSGTNRIYLAFVSDSALATHPTLAYTTKIVFRDS